MRTRFLAVLVLLLALLSACDRPVPRENTTATAEAQQTAEAKPTTCHPLDFQTTGEQFLVGNESTVYRWTCRGELHRVDLARVGVIGNVEFMVKLAPGEQIYFGGQNCSLTWDGRSVSVSGDATASFEVTSTEPWIKATVQCRGELPETLVWHFH